MAAEPRSEEAPRLFDPAMAAEFRDKVSTFEPDRDPEDEQSLRLYYMHRTAPALAPRAWVRCRAGHVDSAAWLRRFEPACLAIPSILIREGVHDLRLRLSVSVVFSLRGLLIDDLLARVIASAFWDDTI